MYKLEAENFADALCPVDMLQLSIHLAQNTLFEACDVLNHSESVQE